MFWIFHCETCTVLATQPGIELAPPHPRTGRRSPLLKKKILFIYLFYTRSLLQHSGSSVFLAACRIFSCGMPDLLAVAGGP